MTLKYRVSWMDVLDGSVDIIINVMNKKRYNGKESLIQLTLLQNGWKIVLDCLNESHCNYNVAVLIYDTMHFEERKCVLGLLNNNNRFFAFKQNFTSSLLTSAYHGLHGHKSSS